ncbi:MAG: DNA recombination protein RmuC, partial [Brevundimonas sp.]|uniref:DNA recombination protein RmuC n=1 Tax=Brevundimonas sp. TaxID=1871086 RepID=UPI00273522BA
MDLQPEIPAFTLHAPVGQAIPLVCDSPHSGTAYPADFGHAVPRALLRAAEDTHVEALWQAAPGVGASLLEAHFPRSYIDANRTLDDLDPALLDAPWPEPLAPGEKTRLGYGLVWRNVNAATPIYDRKLTVAEVQARMGESLQGSATRTARSLGDLHQRLETIDRAQANIEKLSGDVLSLQDILSNKQTRGAFGEIQLHDIVLKALPPDSYTLQAVLPNGRRADCLIHLPKPPGPIVVDAKFPLEGYEALRAARTPAAVQEASR